MVVLSAKLLKLWGKFQVKLKILISLVQMLGGVGITCERSSPLVLPKDKCTHTYGRAIADSIPDPPLYQGLLNVLSTVAQIDLPEAMPLNCIEISREGGAIDILPCATLCSKLSILPEN